MAQTGQSAGSQNLNFQQMSEEIKAGKILLLDVREEKELVSDGKIPTSKNIPLGELAAAMKLGDTEFQEKYGFDKPNSTQPIVIHCKMGGRASRAASAFNEDGFSDVRVYPGILDWKENGGELE